MKKKVHFLLLAIFSISASISANVLNPVSSLTAKRSGDNIVVNWTIPSGSEATSVVLSYNENQKNIAASANSDTLFNASESENYQITVKLSNGATLSKAYEVTVPSVKYAFVTTYASVNAIEDDDEIAAAQWFQTKYAANGVVLSTNDIANADLSQYKVIWVHVDRVGTGALPAQLTANSVLDKLKNYYQSGGNLILTTHATQYIADLGRIPSNRKPGIIGAGSGTSNSDIWSINVNIGMVYDYSEHPLFHGLNTIPDYGHPTIPLIGAGFKEDHNCMWDLNSYGYAPANGSNVVLSFEEENSATVMATWGHVTDFCCAGIVDFLPTSTYSGECIAIGLAAYEWNQNSGINTYQNNIIGLTKNAFDYLKSEIFTGKESSGTSGVSANQLNKEYTISKDQVTFYNPENIVSAKIYNTAGVVVLNADKLKSINLKEMNSGVYILSIKTKDGASITDKFIR